MKHTTTLRFDALASYLVVCASMLVLTGCGGSVYSLGNIRDDGGDDGGIGFVFDGTDASSDGRSGGGLESGVDECQAEAAACSGGAMGYSAGAIKPGLSCTSGYTDYCYCCFPWPDNGACVPFSEFPCDRNSYAYQCLSGTPPEIDPKLSCGESFPDSNGSNDFCCTYQ